MLSLAPSCAFSLVIILKIYVALEPLPILLTVKLPCFLLGSLDPLLDSCLLGSQDPLLDSCLLLHPFPDSCLLLDPLPDLCLLLDSFTWIHTNWNYLLGSPDPLHDSCLILDPLVASVCRLHFLLTLHMRK